MRLASLAGATVVLGSAAACGLSVTGTATGRDAQTYAASDGGLGVQTPQSPIATFACGSETCVAGAQACCASTSSFACSSLDAGCPLTDAGSTDAQPPLPLQCTSSTDCLGDDRCCFDSVTGSACTSSCASNQIELCRVGIEGCGDDGLCVDAAAVTPLSGIGRCDFTEGG
jgi:hypothetical protein